MKIPVIIDTDPGLDDALALMVAFASEELDIRMITTVAGNQTVEKTTSNGAKVLELGEKEIPLYQGAKRPLLREPVYAGEIHGDSGIGSVILPSPNVEVRQNAYQAIYEEAVRLGKSLQIIALGPLTNIANTILGYPELKNHVEKIVLMGGGHAFGNTTPCAEFNIFADAEAAKVVFESEIPIVMVGLDATHQAYILEEEIDSLFVGNSKKEGILKQFMWDLVGVSKRFKFGNAHMHDLLAVMATYEPSVIKGGNYRVDVEVKGQLTYGKTVVDVEGKSKRPINAFVALGTDREKFLKILKEKFASFAE